MLGESVQEDVGMTVSKTVGLYLFSSFCFVLTLLHIVQVYN